MTSSPVSQQDRFVHERLPPAAEWPDLVRLPGLEWDGPLNCVDWLLERHIAAGHAARPALLGGTRCWTYGELHERVCRIAAVMAEDYGIVSGNRVLIRGANTPEVVAIWLAIEKLGAVAVTTMSLLRSGELGAIIEISRPALAMCEDALAPELDAAIKAGGQPLPVIRFGEDSGELYRRMAARRPKTATCATFAGDISIIGFTSGTTGRPKATIHFQRDLLAICRTVCDHIVVPRSDDVFIGTAPLAFTFGLGGLLIFPLYAGAAAVLNPRYTPKSLLEAIGRYRATICFTVPTFYQQMLKHEAASLASLRTAVCSGEALPLPVRHAWRQQTGIELTEVLGSTEMLHAFIGARPEHMRPGFIGPPIVGYEARIVDDAGQPLPPGEIGRLAVRGPTGCRYLADARQRSYVQGGWNLTGDACSMSADGYVAYHTRYDDMIISAGYNISGVEVENALLEHPDVAECAVVGEPDPERGQIVVAHVVARSVPADPAELARRLQEHVKGSIAPYKYPRAIRFTDRLPRNESGKIQRFRLRE